MKTLFILTISCFLSFAVRAQLVVKAVCDVFVVDILDGKVNGLKANARYDEIKEKLPCFSSTEPEGNASKCGGQIAYKDRDVYFFTDRDYIEIREKFQGKFTTPIMGAARNSLFKVLGNPKLKDANWDAYEMAYGTLVLHFNKAGKVNLVQFSTRGTETLSLCE